MSILVKNKMFKFATDGEYFPLQRLNILVMPIDSSNLSSEYPTCEHVDCVFFDCPLSLGPCLNCTELDI